MTLNNVLQSLPVGHAVFKSLEKYHLMVIEITSAILQALRVTSGADYIVNIFEKYLDDPTNQEVIQHIKVVAELCGIPLYEFGEHGFELCVVAQTLSDSPRFFRE